MKVQCKSALSGVKVRWGSGESPVRAQRILVSVHTNLYHYIHTGINIDLPLLTCTDWIPSGEPKLPLPGWYAWGQWVKPQPTRGPNSPAHRVTPGWDAWGAHPDGNVLRWIHYDKPIAWEKKKSICNFMQLLIKEKNQTWCKKVPAKITERHNISATCWHICGGCIKPYFPISVSGKIYLHVKCPQRDLCTFVVQFFLGLIALIHIFRLTESLRRRRLPKR